MKEIEHTFKNDLSNNFGCTKTTTCQLITLFIICICLMGICEINFLFFTQKNFKVAIQFSSMTELEHQINDPQKMKSLITKPQFFYQIEEQLMNKIVWIYWTFIFLLSPIGLFLTTSHQFMIVFELFQSNQFCGFLFGTTTFVIYFFILYCFFYLIWYSFYMINTKIYSLSVFANYHFAEIIAIVTMINMVFPEYDMKLYIIVFSLFAIHPKKVLMVLPFIGMERLMKWKQFLDDNQMDLGKKEVIENSTFINQLVMFSIILSLTSFLKNWQKEREHEKR